MGLVSRFPDFIPVLPGGGFPACIRPGSLPASSSSGVFSLLSPAAYVMIVLPTLEGLLSSRPQHFSIQYQYTAPIIPFVFISAIRTTRNLLRWKWLEFKPGYLIIFLLIVSLTEPSGSGEFKEEILHRK